MAWATSIVWEVRTAGNDANGGAFNSAAAGTDYSRQDAKNTAGNNISTTDAVAVGTTTITSATASFSSAIVGNLVYFSGGTGSIAAVRKEVTGFTNSTTITIDSSIAASTGMTMNIGGALLSPGYAAGFIAYGHIIYIKNGTYSITTATPNIAGGPIVIDGTGSNDFSAIIGYSSTRTPTNTDTKPILQGAASTITMITGAASGPIVTNVAFDGASQTTAKAVAGSYGPFFYRCSFTGFNAAGSLAGAYTACTATANSVTPMLGYIMEGCEAYSNTATGFDSSSGQAHFFNCLSYNNSGGSSCGFALGYSCIAKHCIAYNNGSHGFKATTGAPAAILSCHAESNAGDGFHMGGSLTAPNQLFSNCSAYNNSGAATNFSAGTSVIPVAVLAPSGSVFVNAAASNFALNNTGGAGTILRAAGWPPSGLFPRGLSDASNADIGAVQHADPATSVTGGGGASIFSAG